MKTLKDQIYALAKEIANLSNLAEELESANEQLKYTKDVQAKALVFAMGEMDMTVEEMLDAAALRQKEALFTDQEDVLPTPAEMQELSTQDSEQLTDEQKQWYYSSTYHNHYNNSIDPENC